MTSLKTPFSVHMVASLGGEVKPLVLFSFILAHHLEGDKNELMKLSKTVGDVGPAVVVYMTCAIIGLGG